MTTAQATRETGWLVEWPSEEIYPMPARWWHPKHGWGTDASKAMRFARKCDAEAYIGTNVFVATIIASEHIWMEVSHG